ncbi:MAG: acyltransferase [Bacteroidaceae bacterium]|nr:acyltransferase [Bacteroidaceae bacterium]
MFLVLWGHCLQDFVSTPSIDNSLWRHMYSFKMALFMMVSGYFSLSSMKLSFPELIKKKATNLLFPSLVWAILLFIGMLCFGKTLTVSYLFYSYLWYLKCSFICYVLSYITVNFGNLTEKNRHLLVAIAVIATVALTFVTNRFRLQELYPCFLIGLYIRYNPDFLKKLARRFYLPLIVFLVMLLFYDHVTYLNDFSKGIKLPFKIIIGIAGALTFIGLINLLLEKPSNSPVIKTLCDFGKYTLGIYILQSIILEKILGNLINFDGMNIYVFNYIVTPVISGILLFVCKWITILIKKNHIVEFILLGKPLPQKQQTDANA